MRRFNIRGRLRITTTIFLSFLFVGMMPLIIIGYINYNVSKYSLEREIFKKLVAISNRQGEGIEGFGKEKLRDIEAFTKMPSVIEMFTKFNRSFPFGVESSEYKAVEHQYQILIADYRKTYGFHDILFINKDGDITFSVSKEKDMGTNLRTGTYRNTGLASSYVEAQGLGKASISKLEYYIPSQKPAAFISIPIYGDTRNGKSVGVVSIQLTNSEISNVVNNYTGLGKTGETVVGEKVGSKFVFVFALRHDPDAAFNITGEIGSANAVPMQHALLQESGSGISLDYRGKKVLAVWKYLPLWRWGMVVKIDEKEAFESIHNYQKFIWGITLTTLIGIVILAVFVSRFISKPIQDLAIVTDAISQGNLEIRAKKKGVKEVGILAISFNKMTDELVNSIQFHKTEINKRKAIENDFRKNTEDLISLNLELAGKIEKLRNSRKAMFYMIGDANRSSKNLAAVNNELESFSYSVSHDLRSPLRALDGFSRALLEDYADKLDTDGKDYLTRICAASERMGVLIDDLLKLSRITQRKMQVTDVDLVQITLPIIEEFKIIEPERHVEFLIDKVLNAKGDAHLLQIMMQNLLSNAWKFTTKIKNKNYHRNRHH